MNKEIFLLAAQMTGITIVGLMCVFGFVFGIVKLIDHAERKKWQKGIVPFATGAVMVLFTFGIFLLIAYLESKK